jgi:hypothetical protein
MARIARRQVVLTWDPSVFASFWFTADYLPEWAVRESKLVALDAVCAALNVHEVRTIPVPWDCTDGFGGAYWRRPHAYLDPEAREAISGLALADPATVIRAVEKLRHDLDDGTWQHRHAALAELPELDLGYRLVIASATRA